ncbi:MAG: hypothetical protein R6X34_26845 [Chloroflexota bacterium]
MFQHPKSRFAKAENGFSGDANTIALDHAVLNACGWSHALTGEQILEHLPALNLERIAQAG